MSARDLTFNEALLPMRQKATRFAGIKDARQRADLGRHASSGSAIFA